MYHYLPLFGVLRWVLESIELVELVVECEGAYVVSCLFCPCVVWCPGVYAVFCLCLMLHCLPLCSYPVLSIETVWCPVQCVLLEWCMTISKLEVY